MARKIFINYRRKINLKDAQLLQGVLHRYFGMSAVFLDVSGINGGEQWLHALERQVDASVAMVALLGKDWADVRDDKGNRRLDNPNDYVRLEIARAFVRGLPVLPVLIDDASMPGASQLPDNVLPLTFAQAMHLRAESFDDDAAKIARRLKQIIADIRRPGLSPWMAGGLVGAALAIGIASAPQVFRVLGLADPQSVTDLQRRLDDSLKAKAEAEAEAETTLGRVNELKAQADAQKTAAQNQIDVLNKQIAALQQRISTLQGVVKEHESKNKESQVRVADLVRRIETLLAEKAKLPGPVGGHVVETGDVPLPPGRVFRDCPDICPEMVVVQQGEFTMGSSENAVEMPPHAVKIARPFAVGKYEVTFTEWEACWADGACDRLFAEWGRGRQPVINVSWNDAKEYVVWLSHKTGKTYRMLSEAEWEYAARAQTTTRYAFGDALSKSQAQFSEAVLGSAIKTVEVGSFPANKFGLHDMHGNVSEWVEDGWHPNYKDAPLDGSAWQVGDTSLRVLRGGSWFDRVEDLRSTNRLGIQPDYHAKLFGLRVARTL